MIGEKRLAELGIVSAVIVGLLCVSVIVAGGLYRGDLRVAAGSFAPEIASRDVDNQAISLSGLRGGFVLVYFTPDISESIEPAKSGSAAADVKASHTTGHISLPARLADLQHLSELSRALDAQEVTVLESRRFENVGPMNLISLVAQNDSSMHDSAPHDSALRDAAGRPACHTLFDADGDIARRFKVDAVATQSTLFVIDARGVIRYRGTCEQAAAENIVRSSTAALSSGQLSLAGSADAMNATAIGHIAGY